MDRSSLFRVLCCLAIFIMLGCHTSEEGLERDAAQKALMSVLRQDTKGITHHPDVDA